MLRVPGGVRPRSHERHRVAAAPAAGKTTLLGVLSAFIPDDERLITIEDAAELRLAQAPRRRASRPGPPNVEGRGEVTVRDLVRNALRMRPDRIIVGEVRGGEALDMLQAMNTGHEGSLSTAHANSARASAVASRDDGDDVGRRSAGRPHPRPGRAAIDVIVHLARLRDGRRVVWEMAAVEGTHRGEPVVVPLFRFRPRASGTEAFEATGAVPELIATLVDRGESIEPDLFETGPDR